MKVVSKNDSGWHEGGFPAKVRIVVLTSIVVGLIGPGVVAVAWGFVQRSREVDWGFIALNLRTFVFGFLWALGIAIGATVAGWPAALVVRARGWSRGLVSGALTLTPLLVPSYLAYHSLGLLRDPTTRLGSMIERCAVGPPVGPGLFWVPAFVGRVLAFVGLVLWVWPLAAMVMGAGLRGTEVELPEMLKVDGAGWWRRQRIIMGRVRGSILRAIGLVTLVMLGSAVPLHLANAPTLGVSAWQEVTLHPTGMNVWLMTWPLLVIAGAGAWWISGSVLRADASVIRKDVPAGGATAVTVVLIAISTVLPLVMYGVFLRTWGSVPKFIRESGDAAAQSALVGAIVGLCGAVVCAAFWWAAGTTRRMLPVRGALATLLFAALVPGVLVGHAWAVFWAMVGAPDALLDSEIPVILAHLTRFGAVAALGGVVLATVEERSIRDSRMLDGGGGFGGWARTALFRQAGVLVGVGLALFCLSLHEIEASIVVQPAGMLSLPQTMLANLHFARQEETSAGAIVVIGSGLIAAAMVAWLLGRRGGGLPTEGDGV